MANYFILYNNRQVGPMSLDQLRNYNITPNTMVRVDDGQWVEAYTIPEVMGIINSRPPQFVSANDTPKHLIAGLLAILIGSLGIQYFYIGKNAAGVYTILLTLVTCGLWSIITLVQGILMLIMPEDEFERKYIYTSSTFPIF